MDTPDIDIKSSAKAHPLHTALLTLTMMFCAGSFGLLWNDHEKIWEHEVRISVIERDKNQGKQTSEVSYEAVMPEEAKIKSKQ